MQSLFIPFADAIPYELPEHIELLPRQISSSRDSNYAIQCSERAATMFAADGDCKNYYHNK